MEFGDLCPYCLSADCPATADVCPARVETLPVSKETLQTHRCGFCNDRGGLRTACFACGTIGKETSQ